MSPPPTAVFHEKLSGFLAFFNLDRKSLLGHEGNHQRAISSTLGMGPVLLFMGSRWLVGVKDSLTLDSFNENF